uniref:VOC family protein n=1 Tax=uncultured Altererythrobacter sp. TaxID=500840 RepID=UPI00262A6999|nr:VOC family protein [uncultured Altererythrobacter sp.]
MDLNQVTIGAVDFDASLDFYTKLGLELIVLADGRYARFEMLSGSSTLSLHHDAAHHPGGTLIYFEVDDIDDKYARLLAQGVEFDSPPRDESWNWREARFRDPAGNKLCLFHAGADRRFPPWRLESSSAS